MIGVDPQELRGRRALVTGAASGIGAATARALSARGADLIIADLDGAAAERVADELGAEAWQVDLASLDALEAALDADPLRVDILVNNAGIQTVAPIEEFDPARFRLMLDLMLIAPFLLVRSALPGMYERGWGRIVNISSVHGIRASPFKSAYVAAKHGIEGLSKVTALEGASRGVTSNCVNPGYVRTPLVEKQIADQARVHGIPEAEVVEKILLTESAIKRMLEPEEVAEMVAWLCGPSAGMVTGASHVMDGGWSAR